MKRVLSCLLVLTISFVMVFSFAVTGFAAEKTQLRQAYEKTAEYILSSSDWYESFWPTFSLSIAGVLSDSQKDQVVSWIEDYINEKKGKLTTVQTPLPDGSMGEKDGGQYTEFSKMIILCEEFGLDPRNVGLDPESAEGKGYNIVDPMARYSKIIGQGLNGAIWALMALDRSGYEFSDEAMHNNNGEVYADLVTQETLLNNLLRAQLDDGGWAYTGKKADPDMTGMAVVALAPHREDSNVSEALDRALECMKSMQFGDGGFATVMENGASPTSTSESDSQIIAALCLLDIDPFSNEGFIKNGNSPLDDLYSYYYSKTGGFKHVHSEKKANGLATSQAYYALAHYYRYISEQTEMEEIEEEKASAAYIYRIRSMRTYIEELKATIEDYVAKEAAYKSDIESYKAEVEKYKTQATINGVNATNITLSCSKVTESGKKVIKLKWSKKGSYKLDKYQIYRSLKEGSGYKLLATKKSSVSTYKDTSAKSGKTYYYKVRGFRTINDKKYYTQWSAVVSKKI